MSTSGKWENNLALRRITDLSISFKGILSQIVRLAYPLAWYLDEIRRKKADFSIACSCTAKQSYPEYDVLLIISVLAFINIYSRSRKLSDFLTKNF